MIKFGSLLLLASAVEGRLEHVHVGDDLPPLLPQPLHPEQSWPVCLLFLSPPLSEMLNHSGGQKHQCNINNLISKDSQSF